MTKRAEWMQAGDRWFLRVGALEVLVEQWNHIDGWWRWRSTRESRESQGYDSFPTLALAQADAVRWLRATIAEMAAACPEVE